ncbi:MAG: hypothetical protein IJI98_07735 [Methanosphaera sp.]|nr:hypothetical protein [Methanosphaera sp.]
MKVEKKLDKDEDLFNTFLVKLQELSYVEQEHARASIIQMSKNLEKHEKEATFITRIKDFFQDCKDSREMNRLKKESEEKLSKLSDEEKCNKEIDHKGYKHGNFKTHLFFEQIYREKHIIADCGGIRFPIIEYKVYMRLEYTPAEIWTESQLEETFENYEEAESYYNQLRKEYKDTKVEKIINYLTEKIDEHCDELKRRMANFNKE